MKNLSITILLLVLSFLSVIFSGFALTVIWEWFVVSVFNLPSLSIPAAIGLMMVTRYVTINPSITNSQNKEDHDDWYDPWAIQIGTTFGIAIISLLVGAAIVPFL